MILLHCKNIIDQYTANVVYMHLNLYVDLYIYIYI